MLIMSCISCLFNILLDFDANAALTAIAAFADHRLIYWNIMHKMFESLMIFKRASYTSLETKFLSGRLFLYSFVVFRCSQQYTEYVWDNFPQLPLLIVWRIIQNICETMGNEERMNYEKQPLVFSFFLRFEAHVLFHKIGIRFWSL